MKTLIDFADKYNMFPDDGLVLCAVSGGLDSMCLLCVMCQISKTRGFSIAVVHFEHGIRGTESIADAEFVRDFCKKHNIPFYLGSGDAIEYSKSHSCGIEEAARTLRYAFFDEILKKTGAKKIATAHNADDNVETVIMNIVRGSGLSGLSGIPPVRGNIIRPLLGVERSEIEEYMLKNGIPHVEDSTNSDTVYTRNRIRHNIIPILKDINPALCHTIMNTSDILRQDNEYINCICNEFMGSQAKNSISIPDLLALPYSVSSRVLRKFSGIELGYEHTSMLFNLCTSSSPSGKVNLPCNTVIYREYNFLRKGDISIKTFEAFELKPGETTVSQELSLKFSCEIINDCRKIYKSLDTFFLKYASIYGAVTVRPRKTGDKITLVDRNCTKSLKKLFIETKIPEHKRELIPVFVDSHDNVLAVCGFGINSKYHAKIGDNVLKIQLEEIN